jgi:queuine tRNA-ribosyltransferase
MGMPEDIIESVKRGVDMFDCVIPTREGRHGRLFALTPNPSPKGRGELKGKFYKTINITNAKFKKDFSPINKDSKLPELQEHTRAYLHHLFKINEPLGQRLASLNNLEFYLDLMREIRKEIKDGKI